MSHKHLKFEICQLQKKKKKILYYYQYKIIIIIISLSDNFTYPELSPFFSEQILSLTLHKFYLNQRTERNVQKFFFNIKIPNFPLLSM